MLPSLLSQHAKIKLKVKLEVPVVAQQKQIWLVSLRTQVWSLASLSGLRIWCCCELWCRSQIWLGSGFAVAVVLAGSYSSDSTPSLGTSIIGQKKKKKRKIRNFFCLSHIFWQNKSIFLNRISISIYLSSIYLSTYPSVCSIFIIRIKMCKLFDLTVLPFRMSILKIMFMSIY